MNRFARGASKWSYYSYLERYSPQQLRTYQSQRYYYLGRQGAFDTLVYKAAADHINYQEDFNIRYKTPTFITNASMRIVWFFFLLPSFLISAYLGDMVRLFNPVHNYNQKRSNSGGQLPTRYQSLYLHDKMAKW